MINSRDTWNLLKHLSFRRVWNGVKLISGYLYSKYSHRPYQLAMPVSLAIEPTTSCNLRCPECPSGLRSFSRPTGMLPEDLFKKVINEVHLDLMYLTFYFQGEPYLHPQFLELVRFAKTKNIYTSTSTNAHFLTSDKARETVESGLDRLIISIDGTTQESYESYRIGGKLEKVIAGTRQVIDWKRKLKSRTPHVIFQFLVVKPNEHQLEEVKAIAKELGVNEVKFKTAQIYDYENGSELMPTIDRYSRYKKDSSGKYKIKNQLLDHCWKMWHSCVITWDGKVVPCCFDKDASHSMGEYGNQTFTQIWQGKQYRNFRKALLMGRDQIEICRNCTEGSAIFA